MAGITVFTAARMAAIEAGTIVSGALSGDNLILTRKNGTTVNAGNVRGAQGAQGAPGPVAGLNIGGSFLDANSGGQAITASAWTQINMTPTSDPGNRWNATDKQYVVPYNGVYLLNGTLRVADASPSGMQFGVGIHTGNADGFWFLWHCVQPTTNAARRTSYPYSRMAYFNAGDRLRMFTYFDGVAGNVSNCGMQIVGIGPPS